MIEEVARFINLEYDKKTGELFIKIEITDPVWKQKILREWDKIKMNISFEEK